jgi:hypothetical protein
MATYNYDPGSGQFLDSVSGQPGTPGASDTVNFPTEPVGFGYTYTFPTGTTTIGTINIMGGTIILPGGATLNANITMSADGPSTPLFYVGGRFGGANTTTINGNIDVTAINKPFYSLFFNGTAAVNITADTTTNAIQELSTAASYAIRDYGATVAIKISATIANAGMTLNLVNSPFVSIVGGVVAGGTLIPGGSSIGGGVSLEGVTVKGKLNVPNATYAFLSGATTGSPASATVQSNFGVGTGKIDPFGITLDSGALFYGAFGIGAQSVDIAAGSYIEAIGGTSGGSTQLAFDSRYANALTLDGTLDTALSGTQGLVSIVNTGGGLTLDPGSAVFDRAGILLDIDSTLDNLSTITLGGGTLELDITPAVLGTVRFHDPGSVLTLGAPHASADVAAAGTLLDFSAGDSIVLHGPGFATPGSVEATFSNGTLAIVDMNGTTDAAFMLARDDAQTYVQSDFTLTGDGFGDATITLSGVTALATPTVTAGGAPLYSGTAPVTLDPGIVVTDANALIASATVGIESYVAGDTLDVATMAGITGTFDTATGTLTLSGLASASEYQAELRSVVYAFTAGADATDGGGVTGRTVNWTVADPSASSLPAISNINVFHPQPTITAGATADYTDYGAPAVLDPGLAITDIQSGTLTEAVVAITGGTFSGDAEVLAANTLGTAITASFDPVAGELVLYGTDSLTNYESVLRSVTFANTAGDVTNGGANPTRSFSWFVDDGVQSSAVASSTADVVACFAAGTLLLGPAGEIAVEALAAGMRVATVSGRLATIAWVGRRTLAVGRHADPASVMPIRVAAGAFGGGVPHRDLLLSPDHAVLVEGVLIPVRHLANGAGIAPVKVAAVTYFHVELDRHDAVLAHGLACESYLDTGNRYGFEGEAVLALHPDFAGMDAEAHAMAVWRARACAPIATEPGDRRIRAAHIRLLARAA